MCPHYWSRWGKACRVVKPLLAGSKNHMTAVSRCCEDDGWKEKKGYGISLSFETSLTHGSGRRTTSPLPAD